MPQIGSRCLCLSAALLLLAAERDSPAAITVTTTPASGPTFTLTPVGSKTRVSLATTITTQPTTFLVRGGAADRIENIIVTANVNQTVFLEVRGTSAGTAITSVDSIDIGASTATVILLDVRTSGDVGPIRVNTISNMNIGGDATGDITLAPRASGAEASLINGTVTGRILGNVLVDHGAIFGLTATGGLGTPSSPVQVRTKNYIVRLTAREIFADINTLANAGSGWTGKIETTSGPFAGSLQTGAIASTGEGAPAALLINGDLDADIDILGSVRNQNNGQPVVNITGLFAHGRRFRIGTSLEPGAEFRTSGSAGLCGQVIINGWNGAGAWAGPVRIGSQALGPVPRYTALSSAIGGGSVGLVPFALHSADSWPPSGMSMNAVSGPSPTNPIRARYYGPVTWSGGATLPVIIESRAIGSTGAWADQSACFTAGREAGASPSPNIIALYPIRNLPGGYTYRITPRRTGSAALTCDLGLSPNPAVASEPSEYAFNITGGCSGDADGNLAVNFSDIAALLAAWGSSPGSGACLSTTDVNADGVINFSDVALVLASWGASCGGP